MDIEGALLAILLMCFYLCVIFTLHLFTNHYVEIARGDNLDKFGFNFWWADDGLSFVVYKDGVTHKYKAEYRFCVDSLVHTKTSVKKGCNSATMRS